MPGRARVVVVVAVLSVASGCGGGDGSSSKSRPRSGGVTARAAQFAACARTSDYRVVRPEPPNERTDFLHEAGFTFAEVDVEEPPLLFFSAIVDFFPSRSDATRAKETIGSSLAGPSTVQENDVVVHYTDDLGTPKRQAVEDVVNRCLRR
ncbi:MAG TPA: hypothetical protein VG348_12865 [Acidimicrobiia bacterium]|nr:hypothetical protein [Acidimicrobiia bacterium]